MHVPRLLLPAMLLASPAAAQSFVNWESPHVSPLTLTRDGTLLLAVNTPDARLEVFSASGALLELTASIPVGLDPVSVRARTDTEAWVVNHLSDSISIVDLENGHVRATLQTEDEPADVVFAGSPERAYVSCSQAGAVLVFDPENLDELPQRIPIDAEDPRAMAVSATGDEVYVAIFESGNGTTVLGGGLVDENVAIFPPNVVNDPDSPYAGVNPPPNAPGGFDPPLNPDNPPPLAVGLIVRKDEGGAWRDDNGEDWTELVSGAKGEASGRSPGWDLPDRDVAVIDTASGSVSYVRRLMNINMAMTVHPITGKLAVVGTDATNEVRFEPVLNGTFLRVLVALADPRTGASRAIDLNPHLDYSEPTARPVVRDLSLGDPRGIVFDATGGRAYVSGMGSNNVVAIDASGARIHAERTIEVGEGPTGLALQQASGTLYVLNKFDASVSAVDLETEKEVARVGFYDPSPAAIRVGRKHLYDTHKNSGLGHVSCASCHVDARMDRLAWDLGDPSGEMKSVDGQNTNSNTVFFNDPFKDFHPMKGPMLTQTLQDIIGKEPHHWRGDRDGLEEFAGAFMGLQGDDETLTPEEMQEFEDFLATIYYPPNPFRLFDNSLSKVVSLEGHFTTGRFGPAGLPLPEGNAKKGRKLYRPPNLLDGVACVTCHTLPVGIGVDRKWNGQKYKKIDPGPNGERHHALSSMDGSSNVAMKIPQLRNLYERTGFNTTQGSNRAGFGLLHDGSIDSIERFVSEPAFEVANVQEVADLTAFMLSFSGSDHPEGVANNALEPPGTLSQDTHAAVGAQLTLGQPELDEAQAIRTGEMLALADAEVVGLVARGVLDAEKRGFAYTGAGTWQSDRLAQTLTSEELLATAAGTGELTWTVVPLGAQTRIGIDRDEDGVFDMDEIDAGSNPADPDDTPAVSPASAKTPPLKKKLGKGLLGAR